VVGRVGEEWRMGIGAGVEVMGGGVGEEGAKVGRVI